MNKVVKREPADESFTLLAYEETPDHYNTFILNTAFYYANCLL